MLSGFYALNYLPKATDPMFHFQEHMLEFSMKAFLRRFRKTASKPLEDSLRTIEGVETIRSTSATGYSAIVIEFDQDMDLDKALSDVRIKVDEAKDYFLMMLENQL